MDFQQPDIRAVNEDPNSLHIMPQMFYNKELISIPFNVGEYSATA